MKVHIENGGGPFRHVCGLTEKPVEKYLSLHASHDGRLLIPRGFMPGTLSASIEDVGLLSQEQSPRAGLKTNHTRPEKKAKT